MLKEKNKPIYKGILALFSLILVILLGFTINVNAISISGQYQYYDLDYEETPTLIYSSGMVFTQDYTIGQFKSFETLIPFYDDNSILFDDAPYFQNTEGIDSYYGDYFKYDLITYLYNVNDFSICYDSSINLYSSIGDISQLNYYFEDFYYEQEDYDLLPRIYTESENKYYNVSYLVDAEYLNPTTHKMERRTFTQSLHAVTDFYLIPNLIGYIYTLTPGESYPNTLFKVHYAQCYVSNNQESIVTLQDYNNFVYHCLDVPTSEYYDDIDEKFYNIKANNENSVTETLGEQIGGFLNIEILPGLSFLGILGLALGIPLLIWILKLFFGG